MSTLRSSVQSHHASGQQTDTAPGAANDPVTMVQEQLATLESLTAEGRTQIAELQNEVADLSVQLQQAQARLGTLSALLLAHERVLHTLHTGITAGAASTAAVTAESPQPAAATVAEPGDEATAEPAGETPAPARQEPVVAGAAASQVAPSRESPEVPVVSARPDTAAAGPSIPESKSTSAPEQSPAPQALQPDAVYSRAAPSATAESPVERADVQRRPAAGRSKPNGHGNGHANGSGKIVQRGSRVEIVFDDEPEEMAETYTIVHSSDANPTQKLIAENSPLGSALLGARPGEIRRFRVRSGPDQTVHVRSVN